MRTPCSETASQPSDLRRRLIAGSGTKRKLLGQTRDFAFYSLRSDGGEYDTMILITQPKDAPKRLLKDREPYALYDILRGPSTQAPSGS